MLRREPNPAFSFQSGLALAGGAIFGLSLARYGYEAALAPGAFFGQWPGALLTAAVSAGLFFGWQRRRPASTALALFLPLTSLLAPDINLLRSQTVLIAALALYCLNPDPLAEDQPAGGDQPFRFWGARLNRQLGWITALLLFYLYLRTLAPSVGEADTFEFQVGIARLGIAHGSGYPLLMLVGKFFSLLPLGGTLAWRVNLTSACFAALAAVGAQQLARRLGASPGVAAWVGFSFGLSPTLWARAVEVEAYSLNAALVALSLWLCLRLLEPAAPSPARRLYLYLAALAFGLSLTNHLTTLLLAPGLLLAAWRSLRARPGREQLRALGLAAVCAVLGFSVFLYVPLRWPAVNHGESMRWSQFLNILTGNEAKGAFQALLPFRDLGRYPIVAGKIAGEYGWPGLLLALAGLLAVRRRGWVLALFGLAFAGYAYFALAFNVPDPDFSAFFIPIHLLLAVLMGVGLQAVMRWAGRSRMGAVLVEARRSLTVAVLVGAGRSLTVARRLEARRSLTVARRLEAGRSRMGAGLGEAGRSLMVAIRVGAWLIPLSSLWLTWPRVDQSQDWARDRLGRLIFSYPLARGAAVLVDPQRLAAMYYFQAAEGVRPDLDIILLPDEAAYRAVLDERLAAGQTVYLARYLPGLGSAYSLRSVGPLAEVSPTPFTQAPALAPFTPVDLPSGLRLLGYAADPAATPGLAWPLTLYWQADTPPAEHRLVYLRLLEAAGQAVWNSAGQVPVSGLYATQAWRAGETIADFYAPVFPASLPPGAYTLQAGLFPPFQPAAAGWARVGEVRLSLPAQAPQPPARRRAEFGQPPVALTGYAAPEAVAPGSLYAVTLYWRRPAGVTTVRAFGETRALSAWPMGAIAPLVYWRTAPTEGADFQWSLEADPPARCGWLAPASATCRLPAIQLAGAASAPGAVNFDQQLVLNKIQLDTPAAAPGELVSLTLHWQGLRAMSEDYTVFVHLLGPDGQVHGQVDAWPVSGTAPTSRWVPGAPLADHYQVRLAPDAPPGAYQIEVGLYLLASLQRLPVLSADGNPVDDKVLLPGLNVR